MKSITRGLLAATAIALVACNHPNLQSTGGGYTPDTSAAPLTAPTSAEAALPAGIDVPPPAPEPASGPQSSAPAGTATPR